MSDQGFEVVRINVSRTRRGDLEDEIIVIGPDDEPRVISLRTDKVPWRRCFTCKKLIGYKDYIVANLKSHWKNDVEVDGTCQRDPSLDLKKIWESPYIQLLCCKCAEAKKIENKYGFEQ